MMYYSFKCSELFKLRGGTHTFFDRQWLYSMFVYTIILYYKYINKQTKQNKRRQLSLTSMNIQVSISKHGRSDIVIVAVSNSAVRKYCIGKIPTEIVHIIYTDFTANSCPENMLKPTGRCLWYRGQVCSYAGWCLGVGPESAVGVSVRVSVRNSGDCAASRPICGGFEGNTLPDKIHICVNII